MKKLILSGLSVTGSLAIAAAAYGHHSFAAFFNVDETIAVEGVVTEFWFENPHARIYLEVMTADGSKEEWMLEGGSRNVLTRRGWSEDTVTVGMEVMAVGNPSRDGSNSIGWDSLKTMDGNEVGP
ncbi:MAG: DUF6152 family protein [Candidatus Rariloculaceae bacterium]